MKLTPGKKCSMICFNSSLDMNLKQSGGEIMKKTKKIMALVMAGLMAASMTACQTKTEPQPTGGQESESASAEAPAGTEAPAAAGKTYKIGIIQLPQSLHSSCQERHAVSAG